MFRHLTLYVIGSEGIEACEDCRIVLTEVALAIKHSANKGRVQGYKAAKQVAEAKAVRAQPDSPAIESSTKIMKE